MDEQILTGRILKGVAGLYYVSVPGHGHFACPACGLFRKTGATPIPGDMADIGSIDMERRTGYLLAVKERSNELIRPRAANVNQALLVLTRVSPEVSLLTVDMILAYMESMGVKPFICVNKTDITPAALVEEVKRLYNPAGYRVLPVSALRREGLDAVYEQLPGNVTILSGASGAGKSSLVNALFPHIVQETGELSRRINRGKNTTRTCELFEVPGGGFIADSPGFTSFDAGLLPKGGLAAYFPEFAPFIGHCYYGDCAHLSEHDCAVKEQVGAAIPEGRYANYAALVKKTIV